MRRAWRDPPRWSREELERDSAINSVKRLNRENGGEGNKWSEAFGSQAVTAAVLAGVFKLTNLVQAQDEQGVTIFWEHDLQPLIDFVIAD